MKELFTTVEILDYLEKNDIKLFSEFIDIVFTDKSDWIEVICNYPDIFIDYFEKNS